MDSILTVTSAADSQALVDLATAKAELGVTDSAQDAQLQRWIDEASAQIANACNRVFISETVSEQFRLYRSEPVLNLARAPVSSVATVTIDATAQAADEYEADEAAGMLYRLNGDDERLLWAPSKIVVAYTGGYAAASIPTPLRRACIMLLRGLSGSAARDPSVRAEQVDGVGRLEYWVGPTSVDAATGLPVEVVALIRPFMRMLV